MRYWDIKPPLKVATMTTGDYLAYRKDDYKKTNNITIGIKIPITTRRICWVCDKKFLGKVSEWSCSKECMEKGASDENAYSS